MAGCPLTLGKAPGKASFVPSLPCIPGRRRQLLAGPPLFHVASTSGHSQAAVPGEKLLERLSGLAGRLAGQVPRPWPQAAAIDLPMTFNR